MTGISIRHLHGRFRCAPGTVAEPRLRRILAKAVEDGLEAALGCRGLAGGGEVCLREIHAQSRLSLRETDPALSVELAMAITDAIAAGIREDPAGCVCYGSRAQALADFAAATLSGDFRRAWAWRQLGIRSAGFAVSVADAAGQVLGALAAEPRLAAAILAGLTEYPILFERLLSQAPRKLWPELGRSVAAALGASPDGLFRPGEPEDLPGLAYDPVRRILAGSRIARALRASGVQGWGGEGLPSAWAILILGEAEPALLQAPRARSGAVVRAVARALVPAARVGTGAGQGASGGQARRQEASMAPDEPVMAQESAAAPEKSREGLESPPERGTVETAGASEAGVSVPETPPGAGDPAADPLGIPSGMPEDSAVDLVGAPRSPAPVGGASERGRSDRIPLAPGRFDRPDTRRRGHTGFGGLLYLINLIGRIGSIERIRTDPRLTARTPRWCLHQLALALAPVAGSDPAVLAFAGLLPGGEPPSANQAAPTGDETEALAERGRELLDALCERLDRQDEDEPARLDHVCRRPAEIVADPGWLEAHFALDQVAADIRAAGLDLDPGWVPWLGLVIRFVYV